MAGRRLALLGIAVLLAALAAAPSASAAPRWDRLPIGAELSLRASHGYLISIGASRDRVILIASRKRTLSMYGAAHARVTPTSIRASFGRLGSVDVSFSPRRTRRHLPSNRRSICRYSPRRVSDRLGVFAGSIRFRGERGYTSVSTSRAFGRVAPIPHSLCSTVGPGRAYEHLDDPPGWPTALKAIAFTDAGIALFEAATDGFRIADGFDHVGRFRVPRLGRRDVGFEAVDLAAVGKVSAFRVAVAAGSRGAYDFGESPRNLDVRPPAPFSGVGRYRSCADRRWSGSLAVSLPGAPRVPLAGSARTGTLAAAFATPEFTDSQCVVVPLSRSRLQP